MTPTQEAPFMQRAMLVVGLMLIAGVLLPAANFAGSRGISFSGHQILNAEGVSDWITIIWPLIVGVVMVVLSRWPVTPARVGVILGLTLVYPVTLGLSEYGFETNSLFPHAQSLGSPAAAGAASAGSARAGGDSVTGEAAAPSRGDPDVGCTMPGAGACLAPARTASRRSACVRAE